jgi:aspartyl-tRNA(Asn)/glutamyl-tRNA(Gln) amidotransferase subunit C
MAKIQKSDIEKLAQLSRLELTDAEKEKFTGQFSDILGYVEELSEIDDKNIEPIDQITGLSNISRKDKVTNNFDRKKMLSNTPAQLDGFIKVKSILK